MEPGFQILFDDGPCLAVCKPPGLPTQAPPGIDSLEVRIRAFLKQRDNPPCEVYLGIPAPARFARRSGAIVFATRRRAAHKLSKQFEHRSVKKLYWVCLEGRVDPPEGTWQDYLRKVYGHPLAEVVPADHPEAKLAVLHYRTLASAEWGSWLEIQTGDRPDASDSHPSGLARPSRLGRFSVMERKPRLVRSMTTSVCLQLHCTLGCWNSSIRRANSGLRSLLRSPSFGRSDRLRFRSVFAQICGIAISSEKSSCTTPSTPATASRPLPVLWGFIV